MVNMAYRPFLLCASLCFLINKYGTVSNNVLRSIVSDFCSGDLTADAKNRLLDDSSSPNLSVQLPRIPKRRDSANQLNIEIDDIFNMLTFADENRLLIELPRYSVVDTDTIPSMLLFEGDAKVLMYLIDRLKARWKSCSQVRQPCLHVSWHTANMQGSS
jgi:hypothetical protein